jgi:threonine/homoserine/homoserine lactone efflux protein
MPALLEGVLVGAFLMLFTGPSFFYLIKVGISKGFTSAAFFAAGIFLSDILLVSVIFFGISNFYDEAWFQKSFSLGAGLIILSIGISMLTKRPKEVLEKKVETGVNNVYYLLKGFGINAMNPFTFMVWVGVLGALGLQKEYSNNEYLLFFIGILSTIFFTDLSKAYLANKLGGLLNNRLIFRINRILAFVFIVLGIRLLYYFVNIMGFGFTFS